VRATTTALTTRVAAPSDDVIGNAKKLSVVQDITDARAARQMLQDLATQDPLTGLSNRRHLVEAMRRALRRDDDLAVVYIDLDGVKKCNDTYGYAVGDGLLVQVAATIRATVRDADATARVGGDEFVIVFAGGAKAAAAVAKRLRRAIETTARGQLPAGAGPVTASIGCTVSPAPHHETTPELLLREADTAM
jgi:diguanylate cyclase (GGDEF)-like protein